MAKSFSWFQGQDPSQKPQVPGQGLQDPQSNAIPHASRVTCVAHRVPAELVVPGLCHQQAPQPQQDQIRRELSTESALDAGGDPRLGTNPLGHHPVPVPLGIEGKVGSLSPGA